MRMQAHIFLMYIFYKRFNCDLKKKGFYCLYKKKKIEYMWVLFYYSGLKVSVATLNIL